MKVLFLLMCVSCGILWGCKARNSQNRLSGETKSGEMSAVNPDPISFYESRKNGPRPNGETWNAEVDRISIERIDGKAVGNIGGRVVLNGGWTKKGDLKYRTLDIDKAIIRAKTTPELSVAEIPRWVVFGVFSTDASIEKIGDVKMLNEAIDIHFLGKKVLMVNLQRKNEKEKIVTTYKGSVFVYAFKLPSIPGGRSIQFSFSIENIEMFDSTRWFNDPGKLYITPGWFEQSQVGFYENSNEN